MIGRGKIKVQKLYDIVSGVFGKRKGIRIKFKKIGYESIMIGRRAIGITR